MAQTRGTTVNRLKEESFSYFLFFQLKSYMLMERHSSSVKEHKSKM